MKRSIEQWKCIDPVSVQIMSRKQVIDLVRDAKADILELYELSERLLNLSSEYRELGEMAIVALKRKL